MIIDCHGHVSPPLALWAWKANIMAHRGEHGRRPPEMTDEEILYYANKVELSPVGHIDMLDRNGTQLQLLSPAPVSDGTQRQACAGGVLVHGRNQQHHRKNGETHPGSLRRHMRAAASGWRAHRERAPGAGALRKKIGGSRVVCSIRTRTKTAAKRRRRWAIGIGIRSMKSFASSTFLLTSMLPDRIPNARPTRFTSSTRNRSPFTDWSIPTCSRTFLI